MKWWLVLLASSAPAQNSIDLMRAAVAQQRAAIDTQRESVRRQREQLRLAPLIAQPAEPACDLIPDETIAPIVEGAAKAQSLDPGLLRAVIRQESAFYPCAVSPKGAKGLMQLMPEVIAQFDVADPFDAKTSVEAGAKYLRQLLTKYKGDLSLALAAYNAGPSAIDEAGGIPDIPETRNYVESILQVVCAPSGHSPTSLPQCASKAPPVQPSQTSEENAH